MKNKERVFCALFFIFFFFGEMYALKPIINVKDYGAVGDGVTDDGPAIDAVFTELANFGGNAIVNFENKSYYIGEKASKWAYFNLENYDGLEIEGNGAELLFKRTNQPFSLKNCRNTIFRNLSVDFIEPTYAQGTVVAKNSTKYTIDVLIQDGYPTPPLTLKGGGGGAHGIIFDPVNYTRRLFDNSDDDHFLIDSVRLVSGRTYKFFFTSSYYNQISYVQINDRVTHGFGLSFLASAYVAQKTGIPSGAITLIECSNVLFEDFNLYASIAMGFSVNNSYGDITFRRTSIKRKPGTDRLLATPSDGIHTDNNRGAIIIDNCLLESTGDDIASLHSKEEKIVSKINATTFNLVNTDIIYYFNVIKPNDVLMFFDRNSGAVLDSAKVVSVIPNATTRTNTVVLDKEISYLDVGITAINMTSASSGTTIKNSIFNPVLRNAMLLRIINGVIENNIINCYGGKIGVNLTDETNTAPFSKNTIIRNNIINDADLIGINLGTTMSGVRDDTSVSGNILVTGNTINCRRLNGIKIRNTNRVNILNNSINMLGGTVSNGNAVDAANVSDVTIDGLNIIDQRTGMLNNTAMRFMDCVEPSFTMSNLNFNLTAGMTNYVFLNTLTTYYFRPKGDSQSWTKIPGILPEQIVTTNTPTILTGNTNYFAKGTYTTKTSIALKNGHIFGGFKGDEAVIDLSARALSDKDGNGIVEPWEFTNEAILNGTAPFAGTGSASRFLTVTGGEVNGMTLQNHYNNSDVDFGTIFLGAVNTTPTNSDNIFSAAGKLVACTVRKIKAFKAPIVMTNKLSLIDSCMIEECVSTATTGTAAVFMNLLGGKVSNSILRNNYNAGSSGGAIYANSLTSSDMNAIVENCIMYNNTAKYGAAIRGEAKTDKRGIQVINCTVANNMSTTATVASVDLISGGLIVNSLVLDDTQNEIRVNTINHYVANNAFGTLGLGSGVTAYPNTNMNSGRTVANFGFTSPTTFQGAMITGDVNFDQVKYDEIRHANYRINQPNSIGLSLLGLKVLPSSYLIGGTGASVALTATIPTMDISGVSRPILTTGNVSLGAYQYMDNTTHLESKNEYSVLVYPTNEGIRISGAQGNNVNIYAISGQLVKSTYLTSDISTIRVKEGFYIVVVGSSNFKVLVK